MTGDLKPWIIFLSTLHIDAITGKENITWSWLEKGDADRSCPKGPLSWLAGTAWTLLHTQLLLPVHRTGTRLSPSTTAAETGSSIFRNIAVSVRSYSVGKHLTKDSWEPLNLQNNSPLSILFCLYRSNSSTSLVRKFAAVGQRHEEGRRAGGRRRRG